MKRRTKTLREQPVQRHDVEEMREAVSRFLGAVLPLEPPFVKMMAKEQPAPVANDRPAVWPLVVADMQARDQLGRERYGVPLQPHNGRDALRDVYEEALDLCAYLKQAMLERDTVLADLERVALERDEARQMVRELEAKMKTFTQEQQERKAGQVAERRERIAIAAMQGMLAAESGNTDVSFRDMAMYAVNMADALIEELDEQGNDE